MSSSFTYADLSYLESMSMGSNDLIVEMIQIFLEQIPEFTHDLQDLLDKGDYQGLGACAHKAKSSIAVMGMTELAADLKTLEIKAKAGEDPTLYPQIVKKFIEQVSLTGDELSTYAATLL